jgi:anti-sigma factor RsiW
MRDCENIRESIGSWLDGELSAAESESVRAHVASCTDCGAAQRRLEKMHGALKAALTSPAPQIDFMSFWGGVEDRINERRAWYADLLDWSRGLFTAPRVAWLVPAVIGLLLVLISADADIDIRRLFGSRNSFASVESIDAHGGSVAVLRQPETRTTVIWLYEDQEGENETAEDPAKSAPSF